MGQLFFIPFTSSAGRVEFPLNIYVDPTGGDDANTGLTPASPVLTLTRVWNIVPGTIEGSVIIHVASGDLTWVPMPRIVQATEDACIVFYGDGAGQGVQDGFIVVDSGVTQADTSAVQVVLPAGPAVNAFQGMTLEIASGAIAGARQTIRDNTGGDTPTVFPCVPFVDETQAVTPPGVGAGYRIVRPATTLLLPSEGGAILWFEGQGTGPANLPVTIINFDTEATEVGDQIIVANSQLLMFGIRVTQGQIRGVRSWIAAGAPLASINAEVPTVSDSVVGPLATALDLTVEQLAHWFGWGYTNLVGSANCGLAIDSGSQFSGSVCTIGVGGSFSGNSLHGGVQDGTYIIDGGFIQSLSVAQNGRYSLGFFAEDAVTFVIVAIGAFASFIGGSHTEFISPASFVITISPIAITGATVYIHASIVDVQAIEDEHPPAFSVADNGELFLNLSPVAPDGSNTFANSTSYFFTLSNAKLIANALDIHCGGLVLNMEHKAQVSLAGPGIFQSDATCFYLQSDASLFCSAGLTATSGLGSTGIAERNAILVIQGLVALTAIDGDGVIIRSGARAYFDADGLFVGGGAFGVNARAGGFVSINGVVDAGSGDLTVGTNVAETVNAAAWNAFTTNDGLGNIVSGKGASQIVRTA